MSASSLDVEALVAEERAHARALAEQHGHPCLVLAESVLDLRALELVPRVVAGQHRVLPVAVDDEVLTLAALDVGERDIFAHVSFASGRRVEPLLASEDAIAATLPRAYDALARREPTLAGPAAKDPETPQLVVERPAGASDDAHPALELVELLEVAAEDEPSPQAAGAAPLVLVVDDEEGIRSLLERMLRHDGYRIALAQHGREAMELLRKERPGVVLLDAMLPEIHGFEICRAIKESAALASIPVIMVSAVYKGWQSARDIQEVHGADAFVEKPFDVHYLRELVARMLGKATPRPALDEERRDRVARARTHAHVSYKMGELDDALRAVEAWRDLDPFDADAYLLLGNVQTKKKDLGAAMRAYERAATFGPSLFAAFKNLALAYEQLGFTRRAAASWTRARDLARDATLREQIDRRLEERYGAFAFAAPA